MFAKLLKHEWRATRGIIGLLCVIILISGLTIGGVMHYMIGIDNAGEMIVMEEEAATLEPMSDFAELVCALLLAAGLMAIAVCGAGSVFFVIYRFYKRHFTDEGYLTYTLPVTNHQLLLSSFLNSVIGVLIVIVACFAAVGIAVALILLAFPENIVCWADVMVSLKEAWGQIRESLRENAGEFVLAGFSAIVSAASELIVLMLAVTIGALIAKKHKVLAAVAVYYGISMVRSFIYSALAVSAFTTEDVTRLLASPGVMGLVIAVGSYFLMHYLTSKKLNLA